MGLARTSGTFGARSPHPGSTSIDAAVLSLDGVDGPNEDFSAVSSEEGARGSPRGWLAVIADGVSSGGRGRLAAHTVGEALFADLPDTPVGWDTTVAFDRIIAAHNSWLWRQNQVADSGSMETTLTALAVGSRFFTVAHVGDSRCYLLRGGRLHLLTQDHVRPLQGLTARGPLTRALGLDERVLVDYRQEPVQLDDVFVVASDGVWSVLTDAQVQSTVEAAADAREAVKRLCELARERGSSDDASAIVLRVLGWAAHDLPVSYDGILELPLPAKLHAGASLDGIVIEELIADGPISMVYRARDAHTQRPLALKTLASGMGKLELERKEITREHWISSHAPACVAEAVMPTRAPSAFYYLYEWIDGTTLGKLARQQPPLSVSEWLALAHSAIQAVGALHRRGIVHRDIKPDNLVRQANGLVRVLDLGVAVTKRHDDRASDAPAGTPAYINPEQWNGALPNERSDLFALGVTLYFVLTGYLPRGEIQPYQLARYAGDAIPVTRRRPDVPLWVSHWLERSYAPREHDRFETAEEMDLTLTRAASTGNFSEPEPPRLLERGSTGLLIIALAFSLLFNVLLVVLHWVL
jgi:serine/threonine protein phosphatase PrpC